MNWSGILSELFVFILPILSTVLVTAITLLAKRWMDKFHVEHSQQVDEMLDKYTKLAVDAVEKLATNAIGKGNKISSSDKMTMAVKAVGDELERSGLRGVATSIIVNRIEALLQGQSASGSATDFQLPGKTGQVSK